MKVSRPPSPVTITLSYEEEKHLIQCMNYLIDYERKDRNRWGRCHDMSDVEQWAVHFLQELK